MNATEKGTQRRKGGKSLRRQSGRDSISFASLRLGAFALPPTAKLTYATREQGAGPPMYATEIGNAETQGRKVAKKTIQGETASPLRPCALAPLRYPCGEACSRDTGTGCRAANVRNGDRERRDARSQSREEDNPGETASPLRPCAFALPPTAKLAHATREQGAGPLMNATEAGNGSSLTFGRELEAQILSAEYDLFDGHVQFVGVSERRRDLGRER